MPPRLSATDERLMAAYREAALRIQRTLQDLTPRNRRVVLKRIDSILAELDALSADYLQEALPLHFREGSDEAIRQLRTLRGFTDEIDETFGTIHTEALQALADDAALKFATALQSVRQSVKGRLSKAQKERVLGQLLASEIEGASNPAETVADFFKEQGITGFTKKNGAQITIEDYASTLTHTILAEAHNTGAATRYASNGIGFVRIIERLDAPDRTCQWMRGKVVSLADRRLLNPFHPNCMGGFTPVFGKQPDAIMSIDDPRIPAEVRTMLLKKI